MTDLDRLEALEVRSTVDRLEERITARFPGRGITRLAARLGTLVDEVAGTAPDINRRIRVARVASRVGAVLVLAATLLAMGLALRDALDDDVRRSLDWLPLVETTINDLVYAAIALFFLYSIPERLQRGRSLTLLHQLRSLAHVIDMHQLTKDPERFRPDYRATASSADPRLWLARWSTTSSTARRCSASSARSLPWSPRSHATPSCSTPSAASRP